MRAWCIVQHGNPTYYIGRTRGDCIAGFLHYIGERTESRFCKSGGQLFTRQKEAWKREQKAHGLDCVQVDVTLRPSTRGTIKDAPRARRTKRESR